MPAARHAAITAPAAQPIAVTRVIRSWPLRMATERSASQTTSVFPVSATTAPVRPAKFRMRRGSGSTPASAVNSAALRRIAQGPWRKISRASARRGGDASTKTGSSTMGMRAFAAASSARGKAARRSASKVPRLIKRASERATKHAISSGAIVIDGTAPAASSTFAVNSCATALVRQCTRGFDCRSSPNIEARSSAAEVPGVSASSVRGGATGRARNSHLVPSAGMSRIRFDGSAKASQPRRATRERDAPTRMGSNLSEPRRCGKLDRHHSEKRFSALRKK